VRALLPRPAGHVDLVRAYAVPTGIGKGRPFVRCNMISTLDGAIALNGRSGMLGGPADRQVFQTLRSHADVILVGAGTVRAEAYGPARLDDDARKRRESQGRPPVPPIAVVTRSGNLDWSSPFFTEAEERPIVFIASDADPGEVQRGERVADVVVAGAAGVEADRIFDHFQGAGYHSVLLEGGPGLNADVVHAGLLDELCLTLSPCVVAGNGPRVLAGAELASPLHFDIVHLLEDEGFLFCRLGVRSDRSA
jgi:riboflavin biosynthesis pyrimidine reductase